MGFIIAIIVGGIAGWLASLLLNREEQGIFANIVVGVIGAFLGNLLLSGLFNTEVQLSSPTWPGFFLAVGGAVILLAVVNLFTRGKVR